MNFIEHEALKFKTNHLLFNANYNRLVAICRKKGYIVKSYSTAQSFLIACQMWEKSKVSDAVSVIDQDGNVIICIRDNLPPKKKLFALAHEIGHIELEHANNYDENSENEADMFAHLLLESWSVSFKELLPVIILLCVIGILLFI